MVRHNTEIKAVIYDVDGTMVDSEPLHVSAWDSALKLSGHNLLDLSEKFRATMAGKKPIEIAKGMVEELHLSVAPDEFLNTKSSIFLEKIETDLQGMPGIVDSVNRLSADGYDLAIGTSLDRNYINLVLARLGLTDSFQVIVTGDQIKNGKPHPETYLTVAEKLGCVPKECVVLEDATSGIQSAKAAGAWCVAVKNEYVVPQDTSEADLTIHTLHEVTSELIQSVSKQSP
ncbi:MAG: HAD family phosphatase [Candidatus Saccharimonadales bacterium]|jgi:HAD superfamily hydrolase (TIGR01509 family)